MYLLGSPDSSIPRMARPVPSHLFTLRLQSLYSVKGGRCNDMPESTDRI
nr:MAG TPA: hypothetical protein [Caudoviricetes sp.]